jgi:hypothetical protein
LRRFLSSCMPEGNVCRRSMVPMHVDMQRQVLYQVPGLHNDERLPHVLRQRRQARVLLHDAVRRVRGPDDGLVPLGHLHLLRVLLTVS